MIKGFWEQLKKPFFCMAPMADVTDVAFRRMFARYGKTQSLSGPTPKCEDQPVFWTEFVSADGLFLMPDKGEDFLPHDKKAREKYEEVQAIAEKYGVHKNNPLLHDLIFYEDEKPIVAQFFSKDPERMKKASQMAVELGFDGIDINMGCPAKVICKQGAGSAMIKTPKLAREIIRATKEGAGDIPVSVKTRIGFNQNEIETWLPELLAEDIPLVTMHARTRKDMSKVPAKWDVIKRCARIRDEIAPETLIAGNGDVDSMQEARARVAETGCDGVMVGRGIFGNPWFFREDISKEDIPLEEQFRVMLEHTRMFEDYLGHYKNFALMKKHFKAYVTGFDGAKELRVKLMKTEDSCKVEMILRESAN